MSKKLSLVFSIAFLVVISFFLVVSPASAETYKVKMGTDTGMLQFQPSDLTIKAGDTVEWVNNKLAPHNVVFDPAKNPQKQPSFLIKPLFSHQESLLIPPSTNLEPTPTIVNLIAALEWLLK